MSARPTPSRNGTTAGIDWRRRADDAEREAAMTRILARTLWRLLAAYRDPFAQAFRPDPFNTADPLQPGDPDIAERGQIDTAFDAAFNLFLREGLFAQPARVVFDDQDQLFILTYPNGQDRYISREQLLLIGGKA